MATTKKSPPKKKKAETTKKKANELPKILSGNKMGGFHGSAWQHYASKGHKDADKRAAKHYTRHAARLATTVGEKDHVLVRRFMDSRAGRHLFGAVKRKVGKVGNWQHDAKLLYRNWRAAYDPADWVTEGTEVKNSPPKEPEWQRRVRQGAARGEPFSSKFRRGLKAVGKATADSTGVTKILAKQKGEGDWTLERGLAAGGFGGALLGTGLQAANPALAGFSPALAIAGAGIGGALGFGKNIAQRYRELKAMGEDVEPFLKSLLDQGYTEEDLEKIIKEAEEEEAPEKEIEEPEIELSAPELLLDAILSEQPLYASRAFEAMMEDKTSDHVEGFKVFLAKNLFQEDEGDLEDDEDEEENESPPSASDDADEDEGVNLEDLDLDSLTDEELEAILGELQGEDDGDQRMTDDGSPSPDEEEVAEEEKK